MNNIKYVVSGLALLAVGCGGSVETTVDPTAPSPKYCQVIDSDGFVTLACDNGDSYTVERPSVEPVQGPAGERGEQGPQGPQGITGESGAIGAVGEKGDKGGIGEKGEKGDVGEKGDPASATILVDGEALRTYDPNTFTDFVHEVPEHSLAVVPGEFTTTEGATGTGWLSVTYAGVRFCYQGDGVNNDDVGTKFRLKRIRDGGNCEANGGFVSVAAVPMAIPSEHSAQPYTVSVHGGGISTTLRLANPQTKVQVRLVIYKLN